MTLFYKIKILFLLTCLCFSSFCFEEAIARPSAGDISKSNKAGKTIPKPFETDAKSANKKKEPTRRAKPAPFDSVFPSSEYPGPLIGVPNSNTVYPLTKALWREFPQLKKHKIKVYGWLNPSFNKSSSRDSNFPLGNDVVPNQAELQQAMLILERIPDTVQTEHVDWGFRLTNLYGIDYRLTTAQHIFSDQLLQHNFLYGYDPVEMYGQVYSPSVAQGMLVTFGRFVSLPDIEALYAPQNYLFTHSIMSNFDIDTQTGITAAIKFNNQWTIVLGVNAGGDVAPWAAGKHIPTGLAMVRWVSKDNNDSVYGGINAFNDGYFRGNHDNLRQFNLTYTHRFTKGILMSTELYYVYQFDAVVGGTCNFGPFRYGTGGGCGDPIPGRSSAFGAVNFLEFKLSKKDFLSLRTDYLDDVKGERTGFPTQYMSSTLGLNHTFCNLFVVRPEVRYELAFKREPYDNGFRAHQFTFGIDSILRF